MKSGSREIQKAIERRVPLTYPKKAWLREVAKDLGCTYLQAENLYYRPGRSIPNSIYIKLTSLRSTGPAPGQTIDKRLQENSDLREELREIKNLIKTEQASRNARLKLVLQELLG